MFHGAYSDFNSAWFMDIGSTLVGAMMFNVYYPVIEFFMWWGLRVLFRVLDRGLCNCDTNVTKKTTI
jgi:hypothetical protein